MTELTPEDLGRFEESRDNKVLALETLGDLQSTLQDELDGLNDILGKFRNQDSTPKKKEKGGPLTVKQHEKICEFHTLYARAAGVSPDSVTESRNNIKVSMERHLRKDKELSDRQVPMLNTVIRELKVEMGLPLVA